ncbi:MAG: type III pantothenate kinase [Candidatus Brocadiia bacterium]|jgi:type III pantothenate kinase
MLLTVSLGNTNVSFGLFEGDRLLRHGRLPAADLSLLADRIGQQPIRRVALASVAPALTDRAISLLSGSYQTVVLVAGRDLPYGIEIQCEQPEQVGADRLLSAIGAYARTRTATLVADIGTAITVNAVSARGAFCGGAIAPGPALMLRALHEHTALLPAVAYEKPASVLGRDTVAAMRSGAHWGAVALVESLLARMAEELSPSARIILTGGDAEPIARDLKIKYELRPALTLEGLAILAGKA